MLPNNAPERAIVKKFLKIDSELKNISNIYHFDWLIKLI